MQRRSLRAVGTDVALRGGGSDETAADKGGTRGGVLPPRQRGALLLLLLLVYVHNQWTRNALMYAVSFAAPASASREFINVALSFDPSQYAILASFGFTLLYTAASLVAGRVADLLPRGRTLAAALFLWSAALALQATACTGFATLLVCRIVQGLAMAFTGPQALSLIADRFPPASLATATSIYASGVYIGTAGASLSMLLNAAVGWRAAFLGLAGVGLLLAPLVAFFAAEPREDRLPGSGPGDATQDTSADKGVAAKEGAAKGVASGAANENVVASSVRAARTVLAQPGVPLLLAATAARFCAGFSIAVWNAPFFRGKFPLHQGEFAALNALVVAGGGCLSSLAGGLLADRVAGVVGRRGNMWVCAGGCLIAAPLFLLATSAGDFRVAMLFYLLQVLAAECWIGPTLSLLSSLAPARSRGVAQGIFAMMTLVGNAAPVVVSLLIPYFSLGGALQRAVPGAYLLSALLFLLAGDSIHQADARRGAAVR